MYNQSVIVGGNNRNNLRYADDTVFITDSEEKLYNILTTVTVKSENKGLQLNAKKTVHGHLKTIRHSCM